MAKRAADANGGDGDRVQNREARAPAEAPPRIVLRLPPPYRLTRTSTLGEIVGREPRDHDDGLALRLEPVFASASPNGPSPEQVASAVDEAARNDPTYHRPDLFRYAYVVDRGAKRRGRALRARRQTDVSLVLDMLRQTGIDAYAYLESAVEMGMEVTLEPDDPGDFGPCDQGYLCPAPQGVGLPVAEDEPADDGPGKQGYRPGLIDIEQGWQLDHPDLPIDTRNVVWGESSPDFDLRRHGTAVLGILAACRNRVAVTGIAAGLTRDVRVVSHAGTSRPRALLAAMLEARPGDIVLIEAQEFVEEQRLRGPVEVAACDWEAIRLGVACGVVVVECAGNGDNRIRATALDKIPHLHRTGCNPHFRDSGAIIVSAAHPRGCNRRIPYATHGGRIDCYAWGSEAGTLALAPEDQDDSFCRFFGGTSAAGAIVAGVAVVVQRAAWRRLGRALRPGEMRTLLSDPRLNTPPHASERTCIGVMPNVAAILDQLTR